MLYLILLLIAIGVFSFFFIRFLDPETPCDVEYAGASNLRNSKKTVLISLIDLDLMNFNKNTDKIILSDGTSLEQATKPILNGKYIVCRKIKNIKDLTSGDNLVIQKPKGLKLREFQSANGDILNTCHYQKGSQECNQHQFKEVIGKIIFEFDKTLKEVA